MKSAGMKHREEIRGVYIAMPCKFRACRAGTATPFNTENSISTEEANYWGSYPYEIEENYFNTSALETRPGSSEGKQCRWEAIQPISSDSMTCTET